ncbi:hypothetical protein [Streptomyces sp. ISL-99]|nr:hypothetical protein [Streptomyces sp. ISL-99]
MACSIRAVNLPVTETACCLLAPLAFRSVRVDNAARDSVPDTSGTSRRV